MDAHKNLAYSTVATAPSPASSGTSLVVASGHGTRFPSVPFNATIWPADTVPEPSNAEIVRVTTIATDTLTITRAQESTSARTVIVGDQIAATITNKTLVEAEEASQRLITQTAHGFDVGDVLYHDGSNFALAQADDVATAEAVGIVAVDLDADRFVLHYGGRITGLSGLTAGEVYFLSAATPGELTATEPSGTGEVSKPLLVADSTTSGYFFNFRGVLLTAGQPTKLFDQTLGADAASIDTGASGIAGGFDVLEVWILARTAVAAVGSSVFVRVNNDSGANYDILRGQILNTTPTDGAPTLAGTEWSIAAFGANAQAGAATAIHMTIPAYAQTNFHKQGEYQTSQIEDTAADARITFGGVRWRNTAAITRMAVIGNGGDMVAGSRLLIYGR